jgi:hypothetical protein
MREALFHFGRDAVSFGRDAFSIGKYARQNENGAIKLGGGALTN